MEDLILHMNKNQQIVERSCNLGWPSRDFKVSDINSFTFEYPTFFENQKRSRITLANDR